MLLAFHPIDFGVLLFYFGIAVAIGWYFRRTQRGSEDFFFAHHSLTWQPVGLATVATLVTGWTFTHVPGESYRFGLALLWIPATICLIGSLAAWFVLPTYRNLKLNSVYEYLELRFDSRLRTEASLVSIVCRWMWLAAILCLPCKILSAAFVTAIPAWLLIGVTGLITTIAAVQGGTKAQIWSDVVRVPLILIGAILLAVAALSSVKGGADRVWEIATALNRDSVVDPTVRWDSQWSIWTMVPNFGLLVLGLFVADQTTLQRYLVTKTDRDAQRAILLNCLFASMVVGLLVYTGLCLLAFYHDHPQALRAKWVANVNAETLQTLTFADRERLSVQTTTTTDGPRPLLDWDDPSDDVTAATVEQLVAERRLLHPNRKTPWEDPSELLDPDNPLQLDIDKIATRRPPKSGLTRGEAVVHSRATEELVPWFIAKQLPFGFAGLVLTAIFAATMSSLNAGINSLGTLIFVDFYRSSSRAKSWLELRSKKSEAEITEADELPVARSVVLLLGCSTTVAAIVIAGLGMDAISLLFTTGNLIAPLLSIYLLGFLTRRATASGARLGLVSGVIFTLWLVVATSFPPFGWLWPFPQKLHPMWSVTLGTTLTFIVGYVASLFFGQQKTRGRESLAPRT